MFGKFWGNHIEGKLKEIMDSIWADNQDNTIKVLPVLEKEKYGSPQLLLNEKPSEDCLNKLNETYHIRLFRNDDNDDEYKYLMTIETLRFAYEHDWHHNGYYGQSEMPLSKEVTNNKWDFDGYYYITDSMNCDRRIAIIPYSDRAGEFDGGPNMPKFKALSMVKCIVKRLNNNSLFEEK